MNEGVTGALCICVVYYHCAGYRCWQIGGHLLKLLPLRTVQKQLEHDNEQEQKLPQRCPDAVLTISLVLPKKLQSNNVTEKHPALLCSLLEPKTLEEQMLSRLLLPTAAAAAAAAGSLQIEAVQLQSMPKIFSGAGDLYRVLLVVAAPGVGVFYGSLAVKGALFDGKANNSGSCLNSSCEDGPVLQELCLGGQAPRSISCLQATFGSAGTAAAAADPVLLVDSVQGELLVCY